MINSIDSEAGFILLFLCFYFSFFALFYLLPPIVITVKRGSFLSKYFLRGSNAKNTFMFVMIHDDLEYYEAILAQEIYECIRSKDIIFYHKMLFSREAKRALEYMGKEIEVQFAVINNGANEVDYRYSEAWSLTGYKQFHGIGHKAIIRGMESRSEKARAWLDYYSPKDAIYL